MNLTNVQNLVSRCLQADAKAQRELYQQFAQSLFYVCLRYARDQNEAQDLLQEGFIQIFRKLHLYDNNKGAILTWMRRVVINTCIQYRRRHQQMNFETLNQQDLRVSAAEFSDLPQLDSRTLLELMQKLPDGYRMVFNLHVMEGLTHPEISVLLDISVNTSKSQLSKAKRLLRAWINERFPHLVISKMAVAK